MAMGFGETSEKRIRLTIQYKAREGLDLEIGAFLDTIGVKTVQICIDDRIFLVTRTGGGGGSHLSEEILRSCGVEDWQLKRARVPNNPRAPGVRITEVKDDA